MKDEIWGETMEKTGGVKYEWILWNNNSSWCRCINTIQLGGQDIGIITNGTKLVMGSLKIE